MSHSKRPFAALLCLLVIELFLGLPAKAQAPWPDLRYQHRVPITITNPTNRAFAAGEIVTATVPRSVTDGRVRDDAADLVLAHNGSTLPMKALVMGGSLKVLFTLPEPLAVLGTQSGYHLYFGGPSVTTPPSAPPNITSFDFSDGQLHGWKSLQDPGTTGTASSDVRIGNDSDGITSLVLTTAKYHHPIAFASEMEPVGDATTYTRLRTGGGANEAATLQRFNTQTRTDNNFTPYLTGADVPAAGLAIDSFGEQMMALYIPLGDPEGPSGRRHPGPGALNPGMPYTANPDNLQFLISATRDAEPGSGNVGTGILGKAWQSAPPFPDAQGDPMPGGFQLSRRYAVNGNQPLALGGAGLMSYSNTLYLHWMVVVPNGYAESISTAAGAIENAPDPGPEEAVVQGVVYDQYRGVGYTCPNATIRLTSGDTVLATSATDSTGRYRVVIPAGPTAASVTIHAEAEDLAGDVSRDITGGASFTVDVPVTYTARVSGVVTDRHGQPVAGAAVGRFLDNGPYILTDAEGRYEVPVPKGTAVVGAHKDGMLLSGPRWLDASSGTATGDYTLFDGGSNTLQGRTPRITGNTGGSGVAALTDGNLSTIWTSGPVATITPQTPLRMEFVLDDATISQVDVHWKHHPTAWRVELTNIITNSSGESPRSETRSYYSAGETTPPENGGYRADGTQDRNVVSVKTAPVTGVKKLTIVVTGVAGGEPLSLYEIVTRTPQPTTVEDAAIAMRIASGLREPPTDPNAFERWNAENENQTIDMRDAVELLRDMNREVKPLRVFVINYEPVIEAEGNKTVQKLFGWNDPYRNTELHRQDMELASHNYLRIYLQPQVSRDEYPVFTNGYQYDDASFTNAWRTRTWPEGGADFNVIIRNFDLVRRVAVGDVDEVWIQAVPGMAMPETIMAGPNAYWCNSGPVPGNNGNRLFIFTCFNYEREPDVMIHDWGHRMESIIGNRKVYGGWNTQNPPTTFDLFTRIELDKPGQGSVGNCHFPVNGEFGYDYANTRYVSSDADDWLNYPNLTGARKNLNRNAWSGPRKANYGFSSSPDYQRNYLIWMFQRMPHVPGIAPDGKQANWWKYIVDMNSYPESR